MKRPSIATSVAWIVAGLAAAKIVALPLYDPDLWWQLAAGREMARTGSVLRTDIFSHTLAGIPWLNFEWLGQISFFAVYNAFGPGGLVLLKVAAAPLLLFAFGAAVREAGSRGLWTLVTAWLGFLTLLLRVYERIELVTLLFLPLLIAFLLRARHWPDTRLRRLWAVPFAVMGVWANMHGGFIYGLGVTVLFNVGARWAGEKRSYRRFLDLSVLAAMAGTLINPFGPRLYGVFVEHLKADADLSVLLEWKSPQVLDVPYFWLVYLMAAVALVRGLLKRDAAARFWAPAVLVFSVWGARYYRNAAIAVIVLLPSLVALLSTRPVALSRGASAAFAGIALIALLAVPYRALARPLPQAALFSHRFPIAAARFLDEHEIAGTLYNAYEYGGYLSWARGPEHKVFMDGRYLFLPFLTKEIRMDANLAQTPNSAEWKAYLDRYGIDHAVLAHNQLMVPPHGERTAWTSSLEYRFPLREWALVYWDDAALVYVKRTARFEPLIAAREYRFVRPASVAWTALRMRQEPAYRRAVLDELVRHEEEVGHTVVGREIREEGLRPPEPG